MQSRLFDAYCEAASAAPEAIGMQPAYLAPGRTHDYVSVGQQLQPILLLSCASPAPLKRPPIALQHLTVEFGIRFRVRAPLGVVEDDFVVISLRGDGLGLCEVFCSAAEALLAMLPAAPSTSVIEKAVRDFIEVLSALSRPSPRAIAGLWAELWLISMSPDPQAAVNAWHNSPTERFDFSFATHLIEVKATEREERNHEFSFEQLRSSSIPITIVSLRLRRAQRGKSVEDLVSSIQNRLSADMRMKLVKNVFASIGSAVSEASEVRFDEVFTEANVRVISADKVPVVVIPDGSPISAVRFSVNIDDASLKGDLLKSPAERVLQFDFGPRTGSRTGSGSL